MFILCVTPLKMAILLHKRTFSIKLWSYAYDMTFETQESRSYAFLKTQVFPKLGITAASR